MAEFLSIQLDTLYLRPQFPNVHSPLAGRGTHPLCGSHALQFHLLQVGGSKRHVVVNEVRDQGGWSVIF